MEIFNQILSFLAPLIEAYGGNYGWAVAAVAWIGTFRLVFKPLMAGVSEAVKNTESKKDDALLAKVESNIVYKGFIFLVDMLASIKIKPKAIGPINSTK